MSNDKEQLSVESIRELLGKVTPGIWWFDGGSLWFESELTTLQIEANKIFIVKAKTIVEFLLKENDALKAKVEELELESDDAHAALGLVIKERDVLKLASDLGDVKISELEKEKTLAVENAKRWCNAAKENHTQFMNAQNKLAIKCENHVDYGSPIEQKLIELELRLQATRNLFIENCQKSFYAESWKTKEEIADTEIETEYQRLKGRG